MIRSAPSKLVLANRRIVAAFDHVTGNLLSLSPAQVRGNDESIVKAVYCRFNLDERVVSELTPGDFETVKLRTTATSVESVIRAGDAQFTRRFELEPHSPLLKASYSVRSVGRAVELGRVAVPCIAWPDDFSDAFVDPEDLYFDGAEVGGGKQLPCWRVLFRNDHRRGAIIATRSRSDMGRLQVWDKCIEFKPHVITAYDTDYTLWVKSLRLSGTKCYSVRFEIGPWTRSRHAAILRGAKLGAAVAVKSPPASGTRPRAKLEGTAFPAVKLASGSAAGADYHPKKWRIVSLPWTRQAKVLFADAGVRPPAVRLVPKLRGVHRMFVGVGNGAGVTIRMSGEPEPIYRINKPLGAGSHRTPFHLALAGRHRAAELSCGTWAMDGRKLSLEPLGNPHLHTMLDYVRFEKLAPVQEKRWRKRMAARPRIALSGFADVQSIAHIGAQQNPGSEPYRATIAAHARCGFTNICWRIDGQCSDFPSRHNTMRYVSAKVHGVFNPQAKAYGRALRRFDMLEMAVDAGRKYGVEIYGWMRFNNYSGNVQSDFFRDNPQFHEEWEHGAKAAKLCLAFEEVRRHKINILVEAAGYGLAGLNLGFLRHPPILLYHPMLVEGYRNEYGVEPPRVRNAKDPTHLTSLPEDDEAHLRWYRYRARFMTTFMRDLRAALRAKKLGHVKIGVWVRPNHCLFDGVDLDTWLEEGLCDEVVAGATVSWFMKPPCGMASAEWVAKVRPRARLLLNIWIADMKWTRGLVKEAIAQNYHGLTTYESNMAVLDDRMIGLYDSLRGSPTSAVSVGEAACLLKDGQAVGLGDGAGNEQGRR